MPVFRINKDKNYTCMSNFHLRDKKLSLKAKGLLSVMLSLPNDWDYSINGLVTICKEDVRAIKNALKELKNNGYLKIVKIAPQEGFNKFSYIYDIYEKNSKNEEVQNVPLQNVAIQNDIQLNTNILNIKNKNNIPSFGNEDDKSNPLLKANEKEKNDLKEKEREKLKSHFELIWKIYPRKTGGGKTKAYTYFLQWLSGRSINKTTIKLTDAQMYRAVKKYADECNKQEKEEQYIKLGSTFFNTAILDYIDEENSNE